MIKIANFKSNLIVFGTPLLMILSMFLLTKSTWYSAFPKELSLGITLDLLFTIPLVYFFLIRKKEIPKITVISMFLIGLVTASYLLPENQQSLLSQIKTYFFPIVELGVFSFLIFKARKVTQEYKKQHSNLEFFKAIQLASNEVFPKKIAGLLATEISVFYYGFIHWKTIKLKENEFTYHKNSASVSILFGLILVILIETIAIHMLVQKWSIVAAWILTFLSAYTCLQIFSLVRSLSKIPKQINLDSQELILRYGFFCEAIIPFENIKSVEVTSKDLPEDKSIISFSPLGSIDNHNIILHLNAEATFKGFYGMKKSYKSLAFFVDKKQEFKIAIENLKKSKQV